MKFSTTGSSRLFLSSRLRFQLGHSMELEDQTEQYKTRSWLQLQQARRNLKQLPRRASNKRPSSSATFELSSPSGNWPDFLSSREAQKRKNLPPFRSLYRQTSLVEVELEPREQQQSSDKRVTQHRVSAREEAGREKRREEKSLPIVEHN